MSTSSFGATTDAFEVAASYSKNINNKPILITGVTSGTLGYEVIKTIVEHSPARIILVGRSLSKLSDVSKTLMESHPNVDYKLLEMDLGSLKSVREAAATLNRWSIRIDIFISNAAIMACPYTLTIDGVETQFQTNFLSPFLFINLLKSFPPRVVMVSSSSHNFFGSDDIEWSREFIEYGGGETYDPWKAYGLSKTAVILFASALARKHTNSIVYSMHPGSIETNLQQYLSNEELAATGFYTLDRKPISGKLVRKTLQQGAATYMVAAFSPHIADDSGAYLTDCQVIAGDRAPWASEVDREEAVWRLANELLEESFQ